MMQKEFNEPLTKKNINKWLKAFDELADYYFGKNYSKCMSKKQWLEIAEGYTTSEQLNEELWAAR